MISFIILACLSFLQFSSGDTDGRIVGGRPALVGEMPFQVEKNLLIFNISISNLLNSTILII